MHHKYNIGKNTICSNDGRKLE